MNRPDVMRIALQPKGLFALLLLAVLLGGTLLIALRLSATLPVHALAHLGLNEQGDNPKLTTPMIRICPSDIQFGEVISCTISSAAETDSYNFTAVISDRIIARMSDNSDMYSEIAIYDPQGDPVPFCGASGVTTAQVECLLTAGGIHKILAYDGRDGTYTGGYYLFLQRLNNPASATPRVRPKFFLSTNAKVLQSESR